MKFCPTCQIRYDEEILRFCTKDGTPLIEENAPSFSDLPSEKGGDGAADDFTEETVIRRNAPKTEIGEQTQPLSNAAPRIVIPTNEEKAAPIPLAPPPVRAQTTTVYQTAPRAKSNTGKIVALTLLGTFLVLGSAGLLYLMTREPRTADNTNQNINANLDSINTNLNTNLNVGGAFNSGGANISINGSVNGNANGNANLKTPTPKPSPSAPSLSNVNNNIGISTPTPRPSATPTPTAAATPSPTATPTPRPSPTIPPPPTPPSNRTVNAGILNGRAVNLPKPAYPPLAKQMRAAGQVAVQVIVDEGGNVTTAKATTGNVLLRAPAEAAARQSRINPVIIDNRAVKTTGILLYNFINQ